MGWKEDLEQLLADAGNKNPIGQENLPFDELARGDWGGAATAPVTAAFNFMDIPLSGVKEMTGYALAAPDVIRHGIGMGDEGTQATMERLGEGEWGSGRENWENFIQDKP